MTGPFGLAVNQYRTLQVVETDRRRVSTGPPLRVLFVAHDSGMYGAQRCLADLLAGLDRERIEPFVAAPYSGPFTAIAEQMAVPVHLRQIRRWVVPYSETRSRSTLLAMFVRDLRSRAWAFCQLIERLQIDVVYTNTITVAEAAIASRMTRRPHVWHLHEVLDGNRELNPILPSFVIEKAIKFASKVVIANSDYTAKKFGILPGDRKLRTVYNGINIEQITRAAALPLVSDENMFQEGVRYVAIVGAIHPRKGISTFLSAAKLIAVQQKDVMFLVIGGGQTDYVASMMSYAREAGVESKVRFLGWRGDIPALMSRCALLVVAADQEPFGLTVIEAMSIGIPVVATRCGGPEEIIDDGETGSLVKVNSPQAIAEAALKILSDQLLHSRLTNAARLAASTRFALSRYVNQIEDAILSLDT